MIEVVTESEFIDRFRKIRPTNFTYEGLQALFEYLEQYEDDTGDTIELDVIGLCCEFYQYDNLKEFQDDYGKEYETLEDIENETMVVPVDEESFIVRQF
tara:strand:+ start:271 stop:567 length:297 start_codon:yes stop_codon:yes gene_type:complete